MWARFSAAWTSSSAIQSVCAIWVVAYVLRFAYLCTGKRLSPYGKNISWFKLWKMGLVELLMLY